MHQEVALKEAFERRTEPQTDSRQLYHTLALVQYRTGAYEISGERSGIGTPFLHASQLFTSSVASFTPTHLSIGGAVYTSTVDSIVKNTLKLYLDE